jgi:GNAT superfamily N-acetyltransferase
MIMQKYLFTLAVFITASAKLLSLNDVSFEQIEQVYRNNIEGVLREANASFFSSRGMKLDFLKNWPQAIPTIAQWVYDEWSPYDPSLTKERLIHSFSARLNDDRLPITFIALKETVPIGIISVKGRADPEFSDFPQDSLWAGSLQVVHEERCRGIGEELGKFAIALAKRLNYAEIYFYTSNPLNVKWYTKRGAEIIGMRPFHNHTITILRMSL